MKKINKKQMVKIIGDVIIIFMFITSIFCLFKHGEEVKENNIITNSPYIIENTVNEIVEETKVEEVVEEKKEEKVEVSSTTNKNVTSRGGTTIREETTQTDGEWTKFTATAYCACMQCCGKTNGITASGTKATAGRTVAMPKGYAFGTKIEIKGMGTYIVEDRGGAITSNRIDIYFDTHQEALNFGRRTVYLKVVK